MSQTNTNQATWADSPGPNQDSAPPVDPLPILRRRHHFTDQKMANKRDAIQQEVALRSLEPSSKNFAILKREAINLVQQLHITQYELTEASEENVNLKEKTHREDQIRFVHTFNLSSPHNLEQPHEFTFFVKNLNFSFSVSGQPNLCEHTGSIDLYLDPGTVLSNTEGVTIIELDLYMFSSSTSTAPTHPTITIASVLDRETRTYLFDNLVLVNAVLVPEPGREPSTAPRRQQQANADDDDDEEETFPEKSLEL